MRAHSDTLLKLGQIYKNINAPFGELSENTLSLSTYAITSTSAGDVVYNNLENVISQWTLERDGLAAQIKAMLEGAEFNGIPINEKVANDVILAGQALLDQSKHCANHPEKCGS